MVVSAKARQTFSESESELTSINGSCELFQSECLGTKLYFCQKIIYFFKSQDSIVKEGFSLYGAFQVKYRLKQKDK